MTTKALYGDCKTRNMNLSIAYIHYRKHWAAFDIAEYKVNTTGRSEQENC